MKVIIHTEKMSGMVIPLEYWKIIIILTIGRVRLILSTGTRVGGIILTEGRSE
jgi:hypothetical protein